MLLNKLNKPPRWHIELFVIPENKRYTEGHILILKGNKSQIFKQRMSFDWKTENYTFVGVYQTASTTIEMVLLKTLFTQSTLS